MEILNPWECSEVSTGRGRARVEASKSRPAVGAKLDCFALWFWLLFPQVEVPFLRFESVDMVFGEHRNK